GQKRIRFFPDATEVKEVPKGKIWLPLKGTYSERIPSNGHIVIFES
ncbi:MAG: hypothetical protein HGB11_03535, partial [Chlorobiales bacterium]|nr:hypothetical protein [Chlorobiales bacterium]